MGYSKEVYLAAATALSEQKARAEQEAEAHRTELYSAFPRAGQIERELASTAITAARAVFGGANAKEHLSRLKEPQPSPPKRVGRPFGAGRPSQRLSRTPLCLLLLFGYWICGRPYVQLSKKAPARRGV